MSYEFSYLLHLLNSTINGTPTLPPSQELDWERLNTLSDMHMVSSIIFPNVAKLSTATVIPKNVLDRLKSYTFVTGVAQLRKKSYLLNVLKAFEKSNIPMILLKGPMLSSLYPVPSSRISVDSDIYVKPEDRERVKQLFVEELSYTEEENPSGKYVIKYFFNDYHVESHCSLWKGDTGDRFKRLSELGVDSFDNTINVKFNNTSANTMSITNTYIYLMYHMVKHFIIKGVGVRYLTDITLFATHYHKEIDYNAFWNAMDILGYRTFCVDFFGLCSKYLSLDINLIEGLTDEEKNKDLNMRLISDIEEGGHGGGGTPTREGASGILWSYYINQSGTHYKTNVFAYFTLFINKCKQQRPENKTDKVYSKYIIIRSFQYLIYLITSRKKRYEDQGSSKEILQAAKKRIDLLDDLHFF